MSDINPNITIRPSVKDPALHNVYWGKQKAKIGEVRERFTPNQTFDAYRGGLLVYSPADTLERAAQALADYSTNPTK